MAISSGISQNSMQSRPVRVAAIPDPQQDCLSRYDLTVAALGYESRARFISSELSLHGRTSKPIALAFDKGQCLAYEVNRRWYRDNGYAIELLADQEVADWWRSTLDSVEDDQSTLRIGIDVSSFSRFRIASLLGEVFALRVRRRILLDLLYATAVFSTPAEAPSVIETCGPVSRVFAGWATDPDLPNAAIVGLGYEADRALGVVEYLEPGALWAFVPVSADAQYDVAVRHANERFWGSVAADTFVAYDVARPLETFMALEGLVYATRHQYRPVLVPFGPKIFAVCCLLVACVHNPVASVWRVSSGEQESPVDREADGSILGLRVSL